MNIQKIGRVLIGLGGLGIILSILADLLPGAKPGVQSAQILGIEMAVVVFMTGVWIFLSESTEKINIGDKVYDFLGRIPNLPVLVWVLMGFLITYILFFISPMFLNATLRMHYLTTYLPDRYPIGNDMITVIDLAKGWFFDGQSPYYYGFYPPFTYIFYAPLLLVSDHSTHFRLFTFITLGSYIFLTLVIPARIYGKEKISFVLLFFLTGLISYGFQFELERGQYNVFAFLLCMLSIYLFHFHPRYRIFSYLLFSVSVQLKLYPAIFVVMLVDDWRNWRRILFRFAGIGVFNFVLLFVMGFNAFLEFMGSVTTQLVTPGWGWNGNHSIQAFVGNLAADGFGILNSSSLAFVQRNSELMVNILLLVTVACVISGILILYLRNEKGVDVYLLLICTIAALTIPISNDYTLSILAAPVALFLCGFDETRIPRGRFILMLLFIAVSFAYSSTLIPFKYKPYFMNNAFPSLFVILILTTILNFARYFTDKTISESHVKE